MASRRPQDLCPEARNKLIEFMARAKERGVDVLVYCTYRSPEEQKDLYGHGRNGDKRPIVTWTLNSKHNIQDPLGRPASEAWDCVPVMAGKLRWDDARAYKVLRQIAEELGLRWGGDWDRDGIPGERGEWDSPHFELVRNG